MQNDYDQRNDVSDSSTRECTSGGSPFQRSDFKTWRFTTRYAASLEAVNGIVTPSKRAPGEAPIKPSLNFLCPICGAGYEERLDVRSHFIACVARIGNPNGARWDDGLPEEQLSQHAQQMKDVLDAVSGVVIPSKLAPGESIKPNPSRAKDHTSLKFACPLCNTLFNKIDHVKAHFPSCVRRYGNPDGIRWSDGLPTLKRGPKPRREV